MIVGKDTEIKEPNRIKITSIGLENDHFSIDQENKEFTIRSFKHPYNPIKVFKALLKIGYSLLPKEELGDYERVRKILISDKFDSKMNGNPFFRLFGVFSPGPAFPSPLILCFKKKEDKNQEAYPTRGYAIYFQNYIYNFFMPFFEGDQWLYEKGNTVSFSRMPPLLDKNHIAIFGKPGHFHLDLSSNIVKKNEPQEITMKFDSAIEHSDMAGEDGDEFNK